MTQIYLIRHGEAEGNVFRRLHGQYDSLLTPEGHLQADCIRRRFENIAIDGCFSSDLTRASLTARSIYVPKGLTLHRSAAFREVDVGKWEDEPYGYLDNFEPVEMRNFNHDPKNWRAEGAETYDEYTQRFIEAVKRAGSQYDGGTIAIFSHGAVIRSSLIRLFYGGNAEGFPYSDNTGVSRLILKGDELTADFLNDNSHLPEELSTYNKQKWWREHGGRKRANMYYLAPEQVENLPEELRMSEGTVLIGMLERDPVAAVALGEVRDGVGQMLGMRILPGLENRGYADQLLGCAFSFFRSRGGHTIQAQAGEYPDDVLTRYEFDPTTRSRNISTRVFDWSNAVTE